jgi:hypothetical protein
VCLWGGRVGQKLWLRVGNLARSPQHCRAWQAQQVSPHFSLADVRGPADSAHWQKRFLLWQACALHQRSAWRLLLWWRQQLRSTLLSRRRIQAQRPLPPEQPGLGAELPEPQSSALLQRLEADQPEQLASDQPEQLASDLPEQLAPALPLQLAPALPLQLAPALPLQLAPALPPGQLEAAQPLQLCQWQPRARWAAQQCLQRPPRRRPWQQQQLQAQPSRRTQQQAQPSRQLQLQRQPCMQQKRQQRQLQGRALSRGHLLQPLQQLLSELLLQLQPLQQQLPAEQQQPLQPQPLCRQLQRAPLQQRPRPSASWQLQRAPALPRGSCGRMTGWTAQPLPCMCAQSAPAWPPASLAQAAAPALWMPALAGPAVLQ